MIIEIQTILERDLEDSLIYVLKNLHYFLIYNNSFQIMSLVVVQFLPFILASNLMVFYQYLITHA